MSYEAFPMINLENLGDLDLGDLDLYPTTPPPQQFLSFLGGI